MASTGNVIGGFDQSSNMPKPPRELESIIQHVRDLADRSEKIAERLADIRLRLLGMNVPPQDEKAQLKEVVGSELDDLKQTLDLLNGRISRQESCVSDLERI